MRKNWKNKKLNFKKIKNMNEYREHITTEKAMIEVVEAEEKIEPAIIQLKEYKQKFVTVQGYRLAENSTIHCADGKKLFGNAGDYYVQLDRVQEFVLPEEVFRKMFLLKTEE